jgi:DNA-binding response OmpR family regulator
MEAVTAQETTPRVLLVEDEEAILAGLTELFRRHGFEPTAVSDGAVAVGRIESDPPYDLVVLDLMLPGLDGLGVLRRIRGRGDDTPVLVLTARGAEDDVVAGLEAGADDYVTKPFGIRELVARARGLLRRPRSVPDAPRRLCVGAVTLDFDALLVSWGATELKLTAREGLLLEHLAARHHRAVTREELLVDVWGYNDGTVRTRTVDVHVQQLRAKLRDVPGAERWIETVRGRGYRFHLDA